MNDFNKPLDGKKQLQGMMNDTPTPSLDKLNKALTDLEDLRDIQGQHGTWNFDSYMLGLYNGLELALATMQERDPEYRVAPNKWLVEPTDELTAVTEQRDRLAEALTKCDQELDMFSLSPNGYIRTIISKALQSLTPDQP